MSFSARKAQSPKVWSRWVPRTSNAPSATGEPRKLCRPVLLNWWVADGMRMDILQQKPAPKKRQPKVPKRIPRPKKREPGVRLTSAQNRHRNASPDNLCENRTTNFLLYNSLQLPPCGPAAGGLLFAAYPSIIPLFCLLPPGSEPAESACAIFLALDRQTGVPIAIQEVNGGIKM